VTANRALAELVRQRDADGPPGSLDHREGGCVALTTTAAVRILGAVHRPNSLDHRASIA
jgi:hypothetical protein